VKKAYFNLVHLFNHCEVLYVVALHLRAFSLVLYVSWFLKFLIQQTLICLLLRGSNVSFQQQYCINFWPIMCFSACMIEVCVLFLFLVTQHIIDGKLPEASVSHRQTHVTKHLEET